MWEIFSSKTLDTKKKVIRLSGLLDNWMIGIFNLNTLEEISKPWTLDIEMQDIAHTVYW